MHRTVRIPYTLANNEPISGSLFSPLSCSIILHRHMLSASHNHSETLVRFAQAFCTKNSSFFPKTTKKQPPIGDCLSLSKAPPGIEPGNKSFADYICNPEIVRKYLVIQPLTYQKETNLETNFGVFFAFPFYHILVFMSISQSEKHHTYPLSQIQPSPKM